MIFQCLKARYASSINEDYPAGLFGFFGLHFLNSIVVKMPRITPPIKTPIIKPIEDEEEFFSH